MIFYFIWIYCFFILFFLCFPFLFSILYEKVNSNRKYNLRCLQLLSLKDWWCRLWPKLRIGFFLNGGDWWLKWWSGERMKILEMVKELLQVVVLLFLAPLSWLMLVGIYMDGCKVLEGIKLVGGKVIKKCLACKETWIREERGQWKRER